MNASTRGTVPLLFAIALGAVSCNPSADRGDLTAQDGAMEESLAAARPAGGASKIALQSAPAPSPTMPQLREPAPEGLIIRTGSARIEVDSLEYAIALVRALAQRVGGYVANIAVATGPEQLRQATIELKVPVTRFDEAVSGLQPIGEVETMELNAQDVGEEYVDIAARVANARRLEERLISLLSTRAGKLEEVLAVERELARVREEIERFEGRLRYLRSRINLSSLSVLVHEPAPLLSQPGQNVILQSVLQAWRNFVALIAGLIAALGYLLPIGVIAAGGFVVIRSWRARSKRVRPEPLTSNAG
jgi:hypothetical protein